MDGISRGVGPAAGLEGMARGLAPGATGAGVVPMRGIAEMAGAISWIRGHRMTPEQLPEPTVDQRAMLAESGLAADEFMLRASALGMVAAGFEVGATDGQRQFVEWMRESKAPGRAVMYGGKAYEQEAQPEGA